MERSPLDVDALVPRLRAALAEDIGPGDATSELVVPANRRGRAVVRAKADGVVAGVAVATRVLELAAGGGSVRAAPALDDGSRVVAGDVVLEAAGPARALLAGERTALNFLIRLSGVATLTSRFVAAVRGTGARILDTRKTTPGWRDLEKAAVRAGGGENHRFALYDAVLVKDNHLPFCEDLAGALRRRPPGVPVIVEVASLDALEGVLRCDVDVVLLDNFEPESVRAACRRRGDRPRPLYEVSGGISLENVRAFALSGADRISIGALTHSAPALDLSLSLQPVD